MYLRIETKGWRWATDYDAIAKLIGDTGLQWVSDALKTGGMTSKEAGQIAAWAKKLRSDEGRQKATKSVGRVVERWRDDNTLPKGLDVVNIEELDRDKRYLGAPNGVIDLDTRDLLTGAEARSKLVTRSVPDPYDYDATHDDIDRLLDHLDADDRDYLISALGFAMWGKVWRRIYILKGPHNGGKSTLLAAVTASLGSVKGIGYGQDLNFEALIEQRFSASHQGLLYGVQDARIAAASDFVKGGEKTYQRGGAKPYH